jgi:hypothetical protein
VPLDGGQDYRARGGNRQGRQGDQQKWITTATACRICFPQGE